VGPGKCFDVPQIPQAEYGFRLCPFGVLALLEFLLSQKQQTNAVAVKSFIH
jgi:hypothetical protein